MKKSHKRQRMTEITRQAIVDRLFLDSSEPFYGKSDLISFLKRTWPLSQMPSTDYRFKDAEGDIWQHSVNNDDWTDSELLWNRLKIGEIPDEQFSRFLEARVHPLICPDRDRMESLVAAFNEELKNDRFVMRKASEISGRPIYKVSSLDDVGGLGNAYEVVLSFAGEDRAYVDQVAQILRDSDISLFYDNYEEVTLWGKNLTEHLHMVYSSSARYCVMFISENYAEKVWPTHERRSAFEKAISSKEEYILPARFDDTDIPGLSKHISYIDLRKKSPDQFAALIIQKLGHTIADDVEESTDSTLSDDDIPF
ncbi:TIR domain-containing protein [Terriglobus saanensis]|uniref:TIR protein n=1 Tax=Terriglobus saanensis (strain ATCC BAA-1853 / DSM 23119 / SP1PR4) TaxID=401053 RepID=E8V4D8_TERSS|nr:TIR domain-containing protein [Terriglobus saanensis]ADV83687.1 TIR protein [Terriglobus saanensis SP1PR4]